MCVPAEFDFDRVGNVKQTEETMILSIEKVHNVWRDEIWNGY